MRVFWDDSAYSRLFRVLGYVPPAEYVAGCYGSHVPARAGTQQAESPQNPARFSNAPTAARSRLDLRKEADGLPLVGIRAYERRPAVNKPGVLVRVSRATIVTPEREPQSGLPAR